MARASDSPSSNNYLNFLAQTLMEPIIRGESVFVRWFPGHGKTAILHHIFSSRNLVSKHLGSYYRRFIFIPIDGYLFSAVDIPNFFVYVHNTISEALQRTNITTNEKLY